jgi:hypothetical protein
VSSSTSTENVSVIASLGATPDTFAVDKSIQAIVQQQLDNNITNLINLNSPYTGVTVTPISLNSDGTTNSSPPPEPTNTSFYEDTYITGSVTGSGGSISLPNAMTNGVPTNNGIRGIIATFSGNETITGGAGKNALIVTGSTTNLTWDPMGGAGTDTIYAGGGNNNFTLDGYWYDVQVASGDNTITTATNAAGGASYNRITTEGGHNVINLDAGTNTVMSAGSDVINVNDSGNLISVSGASKITFGANATGNTLYATGAATIVGNSGGNTISISGSQGAAISTSGAGSLGSVAGNTTIYSSTDDESVQFTAGTNRFRNNGGFDTIVATGQSVVRAGNPTGSTGKIDFINQSTNAVTVLGGAGAVTAFGGVGGGIITGGAEGNNSLIGGSGSATLVGGGNGDFIEAGGGNATPSGAWNALFAGVGNETLTATSVTGSNLFAAGSGNDIISSEGTGTQYFFTGSGNATITGSSLAGSDNIYFARSGGTSSQDIINNFSTQRDIMVMINGQTISSVTATSNASPQTGAVLTLSDNTRITMVGINPNQLQQFVGGSFV